MRRPAGSLSFLSVETRERIPRWCDLPKALSFYLQKGDCVISNLCSTIKDLILGCQPSTTSRPGRIAHYRIDYPRIARLFALTVKQSPPIATQTDKLLSAANTHDWTLALILFGALRTDTGTVPISAYPFCWR